MKLKVGINASGVALEAIPFPIVRKAIALILAQGSCFLQKRPDKLDRHVMAGLRAAFINGAMFDFGTIPQIAPELGRKADAAWLAHTLIHPYPQWAAVIRLCDDRNVKLTYLFAVNGNPEGIPHFMPEVAKLNKVFTLGLWAVSSKVTSFLAASEVAMHPDDGGRPVVNARISADDTRKHGQACVYSAVDVFIQALYLLSQSGVSRTRTTMAWPPSQHTSGHRTYMLLNSEPYITRLKLGQDEPTPGEANTKHVGHGSPSPHDRRGHTRTMRSGKVVMVRPAKVGHGVTRRRHYEAEISP